MNSIVHADEIALKLKDLLACIAKKEVRIEKERQKLAKMKGFEPISAFRYLSGNTSFILVSDISRVLEEHKVNYISEDDCKYIVKYYD